MTDEQKKRCKLEGVLCNPQNEKEAAERFKGLEVVLHELVEVGAFYVSSMEQINATCKALRIKNYNKN